MNKYRVVCKTCRRGDVVTIDNDNRIFWQNNEFIVSGRYRLDNNWGWQCLCGNNNLLTEQEAKEITNKVNPDPNEINRIVQNIKLDKKTKFEMEKL